MFISLGKLMGIYAIIILAFGMSMDGFAVSIGKGATLNRPPFREAIRIGVIFGAVEAITPVVGWAAGITASQYIVQWDHWIAFLLLMILGLRMVWAGLLKKEDVNKASPKRHGFAILITTAIATSIDAMAVSVGLAFLDNNITLTALLIGLATTLMVTIGMILGRYLGVAIGRWAEVFGGVILVGIGSSILIEHLSQAA